MKTLIPVRKHVPLTGTLAFPAVITIAGLLESDETACGQLVEEFASTGFRARSARADSGAEVLLLRDRAVRHPEGYELTVRQKRIVIRASADAGIYHGAQTLRSLLRLHGKRVPCCRIEDEPHFSRRGVYIDCSRGKVPRVEAVKSLVGLLASWKVNELQLYVENVFTFRKHPAIGRGFSPFTAADIREIQDHCARHHVDFVPSLSSFGHMEKILVLPGYRELGELAGFKGLAGGSTLCPGDPGSIRLVRDLYSEFVPLFRARDFNVCGDEPWELGKGRSKARAGRIGRGRVYLDFMLKLRDLCADHDKRMNMWGDIVLEHPEIIPLLPKDIVQLNWDYGPGHPGSRIARTSKFRDAGLPLLCCSGTNGWSSYGSRLETAFRNVEDFTAEAVRNSAEGILHTDWGDGGHRNTQAVSLCSMAHAAGYAWSPQNMTTAGHPERFASEVFGDGTGRLASMLRVLGDEASGEWAYNALTTSMVEEKSFFEFFGHGGYYKTTKAFSIPKSSTESGRRRVSELRKFRFEKTFRTGKAFEDSLLRQYDIAAEMDSLSWERLVLHRGLKSRAKDRRGLGLHRERYAEMKKRFEKIWLETNRPSRLKDNLRGMAGALAELDSLLR